MVAVLLLVIIYLAFISLGLPDSLLGSAWPLMHRDIGVPLHYAGIIAMIGSACTVVSSIFSARIIRRFGTGKVTAVSVTMTAGALMAFSFSKSFVLLCVCVIPLGLGAGSVDAALNNYVALHYKAKHMNWLHCFWGLGVTISPLVMSSYLSSNKAWYNGYRLIAGIQCALAALLFIALPLWHKHVSTQGAGREAEAKQRPHPALKILFAQPGLKQILAVFFCYCSLEAVTGLWGASFLVTVRNIPPELAARWVSLYYAGIMSERFISGFLTMRFSNKQLIRTAMGVIALGVTILLLPFNTLLAAGFFLTGFGCAPVYPSLIHETPRSFGSSLSQAVIGLQMAGAYVGTTLMPPLFGRLAAWFGFAILPVAVIVLLVCQLVLFETAVRVIERTGAGEISDF